MLLLLYSERADCWLVEWLFRVKLQCYVYCIELLMELHFKATGRHLPYGITQCYLPPHTS